MANGGAVPIVVNGVNFGGDASIQWNGNAVSTQVSDSQTLTATLPTDALTSPQTLTITVSTGGVQSNGVPFQVLSPQPVIALLDPPQAVAGSAGFTLNVYGGFGAGDFALQMVKTPEFQSFTPQ